MTPEERQSIVNEAVEKTLLMIPEVIGNLIMNHAAKLRANKKFYEKHPEYAKHKDIVASVIENLENSDPSQDLVTLIESALPKIDERIKMVGNLDLNKVEKPKLKVDHGAL